jgi:hypothetical protein
VFATVPPSHRWEDFAERVQLLADATGLALQVPDETQSLDVQRGDVERCRTAADERIDALIAVARETRLAESVEAEGDDEKAPF